MFTHSLRWRIQIWHGLLLAAALTGFGILAFHYQKNTVVEQIDLELDQQMATVISAIRHPENDEPVAQGPSRRKRPPFPRRQNQAGGGPRGFLDSDESDQLTELHDSYLVIWRRDGVEMGRSGDVPKSVSRPETVARVSSISHKRARGSLREIYRFLKPGECILIGTSTESKLSELRRLGWQLAGSGFGVLALGLLGGWWFASRAIRPVNAITRSARQFAKGDLRERIPIENNGGELGQLACDLNETFAQLENAFDRQARFTADAAHELRTPVTVILSHAQAALSRERDAEAYKASLVTCERGAKRLQQLIDTLLDLATLDAKADSVSMSETDLATIVSDCVELMSPLAETRQINLILDLEPASCQGNADRLFQILTNLLRNAISFSKDGGIIHVATGKDEDHVYARVQDEGVGIAPEHLPHLFDRFYRADDSRERGKGGAGLGLAICQEIAQLHGGKLTIESQSGVGTTVTLKLPLSATATPVSRESEV